MLLLALDLHMHRGACLRAQKLIKQGARVVLENGKSTKVWEDQWIGSTPASKAASTRLIPSSLRHLLRPDMKVSELMTIPGKEWNREVVENIFPPDISRKILAIHPQGDAGIDTYAWDYTHTGFYTVKSGFWVHINIINTDQTTATVNQPSFDVLYQQIWKLQISSKIRHFLWKCLSNTLPTAANMRHRHIVKDGSCGRCDMDSESVNHILFTCPYARLIWALSPIQAPPNGVMSDSLYANIY